MSLSINDGKLMAGSLICEVSLLQHVPCSGADHLFRDPLYVLDHLLSYEKHI